MKSQTFWTMFNSSLQLPSFQCLPPASDSLYLALASTLRPRGLETTCSLGSLQLRIITACASPKLRLCPGWSSWTENDSEGSAYLTPIKYGTTFVTPMWPER